jgi:serine/threonine protein kinase
MSDPLEINPDDYPRVRLIGSGCFGKVFLCESPNSGPRVAVKIVEVDPEGETGKYFTREVDCMRRMHHPATLSLLGYKNFTAEDPVGVIVMDFMPNGDLKDLLEKFYNGASPPEWDATARSKAVIGIAAGMAHMHSLDMLHRDLKPDNIFLDEHYEIRIADFGRAREQSAEMTETPGNAMAAAPEVFETGEYTNKVDVYAFAILVYYLFAKPTALDDQPGKGFPTTVFAMSGRVGKGARLVRKPEIPPFYWDLIRRCWHAAPEFRPSFLEILQLLKADRAWVLPGSDVAAVEAYQARVLEGFDLPEPAPPPAPAPAPAPAPPRAASPAPVAEPPKPRPADQAQPPVKGKSETNRVDERVAPPVVKKKERWCCLLL